ncbi:MAG: ABC transporter ATP-binding protein [Anaerolineae bacterium]|nr:ABC transporter ATP-binding protein [Phycisphaerae bacterium]
MTSVRIDHLRKHFGATVALAGIDLEIAGGELFFLLGPSGCGKSTLLRIIAGLLAPDSGSVYFDNRDVTNLPTEKRNAVMCFQSYALWPHMSVRENIRFGLAVRKLDKAHQDVRIAEVLRLVQMENLGERKPNQLSGGQQQRVALARALAVRPDCLLLDEPLSNLDATLRQEMRSEIRRICKAAGLTTIYVTHDQKEALSVADRIAVMKDGKLMQVGSPGELYHRPTSAFVAAFLGGTNLLSGRIVEQNHETASIDTSAGRVIAKLNSPLQTSQDVILSIRPEQLQFVRNGSMNAKQNRLVGTPIEMTFLGEATEHLLQVNGQRMKVICAPPVFDPPAQMTVEFDPDDVVVLRG